MAVTVDIGAPTVTFTARSASVSAPTDSLGPRLGAPLLQFMASSVELAGSSWDAAIDIAPWLGTSYINLDGFPEQDATIPVDFTTADVITDPDEPAYGIGSPLSPRIWFKYTPTDPSAISLWFTNAMGAATYVVDMDAWTGSTLDDLTDVADHTSGIHNGSSEEIDLTISAGATYYFRGWPNSSTDLHPAQLHVTMINRVAQLALQWTDLNDDGTLAITRTPANARVSVLNGTPADVLSFYVDSTTGTIVGNGTVNSNGTIIGSTIALPALTATTHTLHCCKLPSTTSIGQLSFSVAESPRALPVPPNADGTATAPTPGSWTFMDPSGHIATYVFPNNPTTMQSPFAGKVFSNKAATAANTITFEGAQKPSQWQVAGTTLTKDFTQQLEIWVNFNKRFIVVDHHMRSWTVSFESYDAVPTKDMNQRWAMTYTLSFIIYSGPHDTTFEG